MARATSTICTISLKQRVRGKPSPRPGEFCMPRANEANSNNAKSRVFSRPPNPRSTTSETFKTIAATSSSEGHGLHRRVAEPLRQGQGLHESQQTSVASIVAAKIAASSTKTTC